MRSTRPPRRYLAVLACAFAAVSGTTGGLSAQELNLPDLVLPGNLRPDMALPAGDLSVTDEWVARPLRYRRLYPVAAVVSGDVPAVPVRIEGLGSLTAFEGDTGTPASVPGETGSVWSGAARYDIQEGLFLAGGRTLGNADRLSAELFLPLAITPERVWQTGLKWERIGALSGTLRVGGKYPEESAAYGLADFRLDRPLGSPDSWELLFQSHGGGSGGMGGRLGLQLEVPLGGEEWKVGTVLGGGGSLDAAGGDWQADAGLYSGFRASGGRLRLLVGLQGVFGSGRPVGLNPLVHLLWRNGEELSLFASSRYEFGTEGTDAIVHEKIDSFESEVPVAAAYRLGAIVGREGSAVSNITLAAGYGRYAFGREGAIVVRDDIRAGFEAALTVPAGQGTVGAAGGMDWYAGEQLILWSAETAWNGPVGSFYVNAGSEDALLGGRMPGIRGELPILGIGSDFRIGKNWTAGLYAYAGLPWESPSLAVSAGWRN